LVLQPSGGYLPAAGYFYEITSILALADKIVVGGWNPVMYFGGRPTDHNAQIYILQRTNGDFVSYTPFKGKPTDIWALAKRSDGVPVVGGSFNQLDDMSGTYYYGLCRLTGTYFQPDATFKPIVGAQGDVRSLAIQADGKIVAGGNFYLANGVAKSAVARFTAAGSLDDSLKVPAILGGTVTGLLARSDGKLITGGSIIDVGTTVADYRDTFLLSSTGTLEASALRVGHSSTLLVSRQQGACRQNIYSGNPTSEC
jgi:hypothetical protein